MKAGADPMRRTVRIRPSEALKVIEDRQPLGMFYTTAQSENGRTVTVGIDNRTGDAWTEEFTSLLQCLRWLHE